MPPSSISKPGAQHLEKQLGFRISGGLNPRKHFNIPQLEQLVAGIEDLKHSYRHHTRSSLESSSGLKQRTTALLRRLGPGIWPDCVRSEVDWLTLAPNDDFGGAYPRDLYWSSIVDSEIIGEFFFDLVVEKCLNYRGSFNRSTRDNCSKLVETEDNPIFSKATPPLPPLPPVSTNLPFSMAVASFHVPSYGVPEQSIRNDVPTGHSSGFASQEPGNHYGLAVNDRGVDQTNYGYGGDKGNDGKRGMDRFDVTPLSHSSSAGHVGADPAVHYGARSSNVLVLGEGLASITSTAVDHAAASPKDQGEVQYENNRTEPKSAQPDPTPRSHTNPIINDNAVALPIDAVRERHVASNEAGPSESVPSSDRNTINVDPSRKRGRSNSSEATSSSEHRGLNENIESTTAENEPLSGEPIAELGNVRHVPELTVPDVAAGRNGQSSGGGDEQTASGNRANAGAGPANGKRRCISQPVNNSPTTKEISEADDQVILQQEEQPHPNVPTGPLIRVRFLNDPLGRKRLIPIRDYSDVHAFFDHLDDNMPDEWHRQGKKVTTVYLTGLDSVDWYFKRAFGKEEWVATLWWLAREAPGPDNVLPRLVFNAAHSSTLA